MPSRRELLAASPLLAAALILGPRRAGAFSTVEPTAPQRAEIARACGQDAEYHARLLAEVGAELDRRGVAAEERDHVLRALVCPRCGCPPYLG